MVNDAPDKELGRETMYGIVGMEGKFSKRDAEQLRGDRMIYPIEDDEDESNESEA